MFVLPQVSGVQATNSSNKIQNRMTILKLNRIFVPDFNKLRNMEKVVVGLSGGVDSFVTALLLQQQGF